MESYQRLIKRFGQSPTSIPDQNSQQTHAEIKSAASLTQGKDRRQ